ncbi:hypothetical protein BG015_006703 [Linnemannia schmuckeri]|uniref:Uncharacterized protein n=1 Tax=Linnemannia schmuckeri TaxID=64567 RepID=A0A9P5S1R0_9FUNG|nr:hypothetical protein BG015_006703 [Linnemannia schmuckeri]
MKIASLSVGLAAIAVVAAQAADPLVAYGAQTTYEWAQQVGEKNDLVYQLEESYSQISELEFRAQFLSRPEQKADIEATATANGGEFNAEFICETGFKMIQGALQQVVQAVSTVPAPGFLPINMFMDRATTLLAEASKKGGPSNIGGTFLATDAVLTMLNLVSSASPDIFPSTIGQALKNTKEGLGNMLMCSTAGAASIEQASCFEIADIYRAIVADVLANVPTVPADASEDLQRYSAGAQAILQVISKNSIAAKNEALLNSRPIFAAELLDTYRIEMIRAGAKDDVQNYAVSSLSLVIGSSNALEACLSIAADPAAAIDDLNDELDALEDEDEADEDDEPKVADPAKPQADAPPVPAA